MSKEDRLNIVLVICVLAGVFTVSYGIALLAGLLGYHGAA